MAQLKVLAGVMAAASLLIVSAPCYGQQPHWASAPPLDVALRGFKDQGVWYFLCTAPYYEVRIPPHYLVYGPPPPYCPPPPVPPSSHGLLDHGKYRHMPPYQALEPRSR